MEFGLSIPNRGPLATPEAIGALAARAEESGFVGSRYRTLSSSRRATPRAIRMMFPASLSGTGTTAWSSSP